MLLEAKFNFPGGGRPGRTKIFLAMRLAIILQLAVCLQISAKSYSQKITVSRQGASLKTVLKEIEEQSNYRFFYKEKVVKLAGTVNVNMKNVNIRDVLDHVLHPKGLTYDVVDDMVVIRPASITEKLLPAPEKAADIELKGVVRDETGNALPGATIRLKGTSNGAGADAQGNFKLRMPEEGGVLEVTFVGYESKEVTVAAGQTSVNIVLKIRELKGDEVVVIGYGTQKRSQLVGRSKKHREFLITQGGPLSIISNGWKYITPSKGPQVARLTHIELGNLDAAQLYDLRTDKDERRNEAASRPNEVKALAALLEKIKTAEKSR